MASKRDEAEWEMAKQEHIMREWGLLDPDQPTEYAHYRHIRAMRAEFTPIERQLIRAALGLGN